MASYTAKERKLFVRRPVKSKNIFSMDTQTMKRRNKYTWMVCLTAVCMMLLNSACERRLLEDDELSRAALIRVNIN